MKLINNKYNFSFDLNNNLINVLVCENERIYNDIVSDLYRLETESNSSFVLSNEERQLDFNNSCEIIYNPFKIDINNKKNVEKMYYQLSKYMCIDNMYIKKNEIMEKLFMYINELSLVSEYEIVHNDKIDDKSILKFMGVEFDNEGKFDEKLLNYMRVTNRLQGSKLYIFINLKSFISLDEILRIYKDIEYNKYNILLIENIDKGMVENENKIIIDRDGCIIA